MTKEEADDLKRELLADLKRSMMGDVVSPPPEPLPVLEGPTVRVPREAWEAVARERASALDMLRRAKAIATCYTRGGALPGGTAEVVKFLLQCDAAARGDWPEPQALYPEEIALTVDPASTIGV